MKYLILLGNLLFYMTFALPSAQAAECEALPLASYTVCRHPALRATERDLNQQVVSLLKKLPMHSRVLFLHDDQRWQTLREECYDSVECLTQVFELKQYILDRYQQKMPIHALNRL